MKELKTNIPEYLPLLPVRDTIVFPAMVIPLPVGRKKSIRAVEEAMATNRFIFLSAQKKTYLEDPGRTISTP